MQKSIQNILMLWYIIKYDGINFGTYLYLPCVRSFVSICVWNFVREFVRKLFFI